MTTNDPSPAPSPATIPAATSVRPLDPRPVDADLLALPVHPRGLAPTTLGSVLDRHATIGCAIVHRGELVLEHYAGAGRPDRRNVCYSVTKSVTGTLAAAAVADGLLDRTARVGSLLPELATSGFADATVADLADMTVAMAYDEDYDDAAAPSAGTGDRGEPETLGFGDYMVAIGLGDPAASAGRPRTIRSLLAAIGRGAGPHGHVFAYATPVTDALGWLLERAHGRGYADLVRDLLWEPMGAEHDALLMLDPDGVPLMGGGLSITTRDLARFGVLLCDRARGTDAPATGSDEVTADVIASMRAGGDPEVFRRGHYAYLEGYSYRDQWWAPGGPDGVLSAWGIYGQLLWVDPDAELVIAIHCDGAAASDERRDLEQDALCRALTTAAATWS